MAKIDEAFRLAGGGCPKLPDARQRRRWDNPAIAAFRPSRNRATLEKSRSRRQADPEIALNMVAPTTVASARTSGHCPQISASPYILFRYSGVKSHLGP